MRVRLEDVSEWTLCLVVVSGVQSVAFREFSSVMAAIDYQEKERLDSEGKSGQWHLTVRPRRGGLGSSLAARSRTDADE